MAPNSFRPRMHTHALAGHAGASTAIVAASLAAGRAVTIGDALAPDFAEAVYSDLTQLRHWQAYEGANAPYAFHYRQHHAVPARTREIEIEIATVARSRERTVAPDRALTSGADSRRGRGIPKCDVQRRWAGEQFRRPASCAAGGRTAGRRSRARRRARWARTWWASSAALLSARAPGERQAAIVPAQRTDAVYLAARRSVTRTSHRKAGGSSSYAVIR